MVSLITLVYLSNSFSIVEKSKTHIFPKRFLSSGSIIGYLYSLIFSLDVYKVVNCAVAKVYLACLHTWNILYLLFLSYIYLRYIVFYTFVLSLVITYFFIEKYLQFVHWPISKFDHEVPTLLLIFTRGGYNMRNISIDRARRNFFFLNYVLYLL